MSEAGFSFETATSLGRGVDDFELDLMRERTEERFEARSTALLGLMGIFMSAEEGEGSPMVCPLDVFLVG